MPAILDNLRKSISSKIFKNKDDEYHPRDEEELDAQRVAQRRRERERSRSEATKLRAALAHDHKSKSAKKHGSHEHGLYVSFLDILIRLLELYVKLFDLHHIFYFSRLN
ncbi:hypothetical protein Y032_0004g2054 [Ancylostoma ceylanicum]|nr:hypothetical protein Y032_0004g2054 [Ancylostoma ceylanicum]